MPFDATMQELQQLLTTARYQVQCASAAQRCLRKMFVEDVAATLQHQRQV
jgi:hypothetical protein